MWRIILAIVLLLLSLLALFKAPTNFFWRVAVAVTEFPYIFILVSIASFFIFLSAEKHRVLLVSLSVASIIIYCIPISTAYSRGSKLSSDLLTAFHYEQKDQHLTQPFSLLKMFGGIGSKDVTPEILPYKKIAEKDLALDFYPAGNKKAPCVIVIHGGSWAGGDSKQLADLNSYLANRGYHVAAINYRLAPTYKSPAQVEDTKDALSFLIRESEKLNIDTNNFILLGRSAGGQIALCAAYQFHSPNIKGVISFYAPADMVWGGKIKSNQLVLNTKKVFDDYLGGSIDEVPEKFKEASSCEFVNPQSPPTLLIHGHIDAMVAFEHAKRLTKKLEQNKVKYYFLDLPHSTHGCDYNINSPSGQLSTYAIERFINSVTGV